MAAAKRWVLRSRGVFPQHLPPLLQIFPHKIILVCPAERKLGAVPQVEGVAADLLDPVAVDQVGLVDAKEIPALEQLNPPFQRLGGEVLFTF